MLDALFFRLLEAAERIRREERGDSLVNWVVLAVGLAAAAAALVALLGARAAAAGGPDAGVVRARAILAAAGDTGKSLRATAREASDEVTVNVEGESPRLFSLPLLLPAVRASASLPLERYPAAEAAP